MVGGVSLSLTHHHLLLPSSSIMTDSSPTSHVIYTVVCASLRLVSTSSELFTAGDLDTLKDNLQATLAVICGQIQSEETSRFTQHFFKCHATQASFAGDRRVLVDMLDWEDASDEEKEAKKRSQKQR